MHSSASRKAPTRKAVSSETPNHKTGGLPKRFPVGTTYVVEGRLVEGHRGKEGSKESKLRVYSRYVVLPDGERINLGGDFSGPATPRSRGPARSHNQRQAERQTKQQAKYRAKYQEKTEEKRRTGRNKKIVATAGTTRRRRR